MTTKVLQFGSGVFLRGFWGAMIQSLNAQNLFNGAITMVKLTPRGDLSKFSDVDGNYSLTTRGLLDGESVDKVETISAYTDFIHPYIEWDKYLQSAHNEDLQIIVSNSTEAGITYNECPTPVECPDSYPAKLCSWLYERYVKFDGAADKGVLVLPMELIEHNGTQLKEIVLKHSADWKLLEEFNDWLENSCDFRNTLVDRIVTKGDDLGVCVEPYHLFAVEGEAAEEILPLKKGGLNVYWTKNLPAFRETKVRMLNGGHTSMIYAAILSGETIVAKALEDDNIDAFLRGFLLDEVLPTLEAKGGEYQELKDYAEAVIERFKNPYLNHRMLDIALNSSSKLLVRLMPTFADIKDKTGNYPERLSKAIAAFFWFYRGEVSDGRFHGQSEGLTYEFSDNEQAMAQIAACKENSPEAFAKSILACPAWNGAFDSFEDFDVTLASIFTQFNEHGLKRSVFNETEKLAQV